MRALSQYARRGFNDARRGFHERRFPIDSYAGREYERGQEEYREFVAELEAAEAEPKTGVYDRWLAGELPKGTPEPTADNMKDALLFAQCRSSKAKASTSTGREIQQRLEDGHQEFALLVFSQVGAYAPLENT